MICAGMMMIRPIPILKIAHKVLLRLATLVNFLFEVPFAVYQPFLD